MAGSLPYTVSFIADAGTKMPAVDERGHAALSFYDAKTVGRARAATAGGTRMREEAQLDLLVQWMTKVRRPPPPPPPPIASPCAGAHAHA